MGTVVVQSSISIGNCQRQCRGASSRKANPTLRAELEADTRRTVLALWPCMESLPYVAHVPATLHSSTQKAEMQV